MQKLVENSGILCDAKKNIESKSIDQNTIEKVIVFYRSDDVSRACPGIREYVTHEKDGNIEKINCTIYCRRKYN